MLNGMENPETWVALVSLCAMEIVLGIDNIVFISIVGVLPAVGSYVYAALTFVWSLYWLAVFAAGKSARAWDDVDTAGPPFFLRYAARVPIIKWYARLWHRLTRAVFAPCRRVEESPWELSGLAAARLFGTLPVLYLFFRPFLPVAAAVIVTRARRAPPAPLS